MARVHLREVTMDNVYECLALEVDDSQRGYLARNVRSLAEAKVDLTLYPLAICDGEVAGYEKPQLPMVGFAMYEIKAGVGFILRLMIDRGYQGQGCGRAASIEVIRRLGLHPQVELIATSYRKGNEAAAKLYRSLGFVDWNIAWALEQEDEVYLKLEDRS